MSEHKDDALDALRGYIHPPPPPPKSLREKAREHWGRGRVRVQKIGKFASRAGAALTSASNKASPKLQKFSKYSARVGRNLESSGILGGGGWGGLEPHSRPRRHKGKGGGRQTIVVRVEGARPVKKKSHRRKHRRESSFSLI